MIAALGAVGQRAQAVDVLVRARPERLTIADTFEIHVILTGQAEEIAPPELAEDGFTVLGVSRSIQIINRRQTSSFVFSARPTRTGTISIAPVEVVADGKTYSSRGDVRVVVEEIPRRDDFFLELTASQERIYIEQEVTVTLKVFALRLPGEDADVDPFLPRNIGTWPRLEIPWIEGAAGFEPDDAQGYLRSLDPRQSGGGFPINSYSFGVLDRYPWLFPLTRSSARRTDSSGRERDYFVYSLEKTFRAAAAGRFDIAPVTARGELVVPSERGAGLRRERLLAQSNGVQITVLEVPREGRPPTFTGAVGKYTVSASLAAREAEIWVGEPVTLNLVVAGEGKLESIGPVSLKAQEQFTERFRVHDEPEIGDIDPQGRSKTFVYGVRPRRADFDSVPPIRFSYFDPQEERFVTVETAPIPVTVRQGETVGSEDVRGFDEAPLVRRLRRVRSAIYPNYVRPDALEPRRPRRAITPTHVGLLAGPPLLYLALLAWTLRKRRLERDPRILRARDAGRRARATLEAALAAARRGESGEAVGAVSRALTGFVADRLHLPAQGLTPVEALGALEEHGVEPAVRHEVDEILESCERARYGAAGGAGADALGERARAVLGKLERALR